MSGSNLRPPPRPEDEVILGPIPDVADWNLDRFLAWADAQSWHVARSMPWLPHSYVLRRTTPDFAEAVAFADQAGHPALWPPKKRHSLRSYLVAGPHMYWHMNAPGRSDLAGVFNRCEVDPATGLSPVPANNVVWCSAEGVPLDELPLDERRPPLA